MYLYSLAVLTADMTINCICIVLCDKRYDWIYSFICKCVSRKDELLLEKPKKKKKLKPVSSGSKSEPVGTAPTTYKPDSEQTDIDVRIELQPKEERTNLI